MEIKVLYKIVFTEEADTSYQKLPKPEKNKIDRVLKRLQTQPFFFAKKLKGELQDLYAVRSWPYRITFFAEGKTLYIVAIAHRQSVYKK